MSSQKGKASIKEDNVDRDMDGMYWGLIYIYINTCPGSQFGWVYIGITTNEHGRRIKWFNINNKYSGWKINTARARFGIANFRYDVLERVASETVKELLVELKRLERYYINLYDSKRNGYNITDGVGRPAVGVHVIDAQGNITYYASMTEAALALDMYVGSVRYWMDKATPTKEGYIIKAA